MAFTIPVRQQHAFSLTALDEYLKVHLEGYSGPLSLRQFGFGQSNPTFLLTTPHAKYVLRKKPPGHIIPSAHAVEREYRVLAALAADKAVGVPVPVPLLLCTDSSVIGTPFYLMEFVRGRIFTNPYLPALSAAEKRLCYADAVRVLAKLHAVNHRAVGLESFGRPTGYYKRQLTRLAKVHAAQCKHTAAIPDFAAMQRWLERRVPSRGATIVHGDFKIDNLVFHPTECRVIAVLDWEMSTIGHPISDLANLAAAYYVPGTTNPRKTNAMMSGLAGIDLDGSGVPQEDELVAMYCEASGRRLSDEEWAFCRAFLFFKYSVITQGIAARQAQGSASSAHAKHATGMVPVVASVARSFMDAHGGLLTTAPTAMVLEPEETVSTAPLRSKL